MALDDARLATLKTELDSDPKGLGYAGASNPEAADLLNTAGLVTPNETIDRKTIDGQELNAAVVKTEWDALPDYGRDLWIAIISAGNGQVDVSNSDIRSQIADTWGPATGTRAKLLALQSRVCSRAETVFDPGVVVTMWDVAEAREL